MLKIHTETRFFFFIFFFLWYRKLPRCLWTPVVHSHSVTDELLEHLAAFEIQGMIFFKICHEGTQFPLWCVTYWALKGHGLLFLSNSCHMDWGFSLWKFTHLPMSDFSHICSSPTAFTALFAGWMKSSSQVLGFTSLLCHSSSNLVQRNQLRYFN